MIISEVLSFRIFIGDSNFHLGISTIIDIFQGYIVDKLQFCGDPTKADGIADGTPCPSYDASDECPMSAERAFWTLASRKVSMTYIIGVYGIITLVNPSYTENILHTE